MGKICRAKGASAAGGFEISDIQQEHRALQSLYSGGHQARSCTPPDAGQSSGAYYPNSAAAAMNLMRLRKGPIVGISKRIREAIQ